MQKTLRLYSLYADLLEYPSLQLWQNAEQCSQLLAECCPAADGLFSRFYAWLLQEKPERVEEIYTSAFDLQALCCPYVGHHLYGDNYKRSQFMAQLNQGYHARGFSGGCELPDHVVVILRFLACGHADEFSLALFNEGLIPAVGSMVKAFDAGKTHPYGALLSSLYMLLQTEQPGVSAIQADSEEGGQAYA